MSKPGSSLKRQVTDGSISPPPLKRKVQSMTTQNAVASFFTPTSQKPPEKITWEERSPDDDSPATLLVGKYQPSELPEVQASAEKGAKIAAFDFDSTLISTSSGKKHGSDGQDWKWWHPTVPGILRDLFIQGYRVVVLSNQAGITLTADPKLPKAHRARLAPFKTKVSGVLTQLDLPITVYAATAKDIYRKPRTGMWTELLKDYGLAAKDVLHEESIFVGDAGGRLASSGKPKDFSCSDRNFAENVGIKFYTPEEYFLKESPRPFKRTFLPSDYVGTASSGDATLSYTKPNPQDIVLFVGSPGAGKSTFYWKYLQPLDYTRVNQDILKTRDKCLKVTQEYLDEGKSVVVDNTNADLETRSKWIALAKKNSVPIRCILFTANMNVCEHNDAVRALNSKMNPEKRTILPKLAFTGFASRFQKPTLAEGFQDIQEITFKFEGTEVEREIWARHWT
ncbi:polynucleotide kinase 3 phosphatase [Xylogone sp. PMI_703]|nr:polynucleotide kinase 3 phosphatase [Xylogone sp. PMI_703]